MSVISNNFVFNGLFLIPERSHHTKIKQFIFIRDNKMTDDFS